MEKEYCPYCMSPVEPGEPCGVCGLTAGSYTPSPHHLPPGTVLRERYLVGRVLGEGGFGITYIGCDLRLELKVAIKEYFPTDRANRVAAADLSVSSYSGATGDRYEQGRRRFLQEARTMARMEKLPVIVSVRDFFEINNTAYIVMEYVEGTTFKEVVEQRGGRIPAGELLHTIEPLFSALSAMHGLGLIHRDISPENLMLERGEVRLLDFGCARESADGEATLTIALKHGYAPVEQYQSKGQGPWTDVYALAATIYYCLTGRKPPQAMDRLVEDELVPPRKLGVDLTERQERALLHGMGVTPRRRFQSVQELHTALYEGGNWERQEQERLDQERAEQARLTAQLEQERQEQEQAEQAQAQRAAAPDWAGQVTAWLKKNRAAAAGIAAALVLVTALLLWHPWARGGSPAEPPPPAVSGPEDTEPSDSPETPETPTAITDEESLALFETTTYISADNGCETAEHLRELMEDPDVVSITLLMEKSIDVQDGPMEITKPLRITGRSYLDAYQPFTVAAGGHLRVEGRVYSEGVVRTTGGGSILVTENGEFSGDCLIWLERETDLVTAGGAAFNINRDYVVTLSEEALFADAVHVNSLEEFDTAVDGPGTRAVVIDSDITFTEYNRGPTVPVLISEGVTVNAPVYEDHYANNETEDYCSWDVNGTILVNRGTLRGRLVMGDWDGDTARDTSLVLNYGSIHADVYCDEENSNGGGNYLIVNQGTFSIPCGQLHQARMYNLGTFLHGSIAPEGLEPTLLEEDSNSNYYLDVIGSWLYNAGEMYLEGAGDWGSGRSNIAVQSGGILYNTGTLRLGAYASVQNMCELKNCGAVRAEDATARVENMGGHFNNCGPYFVVDLPEHFYNVGLFQRGKLVGTVNIPDDADKEGGATLPFVWHDCDQNDPQRPDAFNENHLRRAMDNPNNDCIIVCAPIELTEDLTVTKGLVFKGGCDLNANGFQITVEGENAFLVDDGGMLKLDNGTLTVRDGALAVVNVGRQNALGGIRAENGGMVFLLNNWEPEEGAAIDISGGGYVDVVRDLTLRNSRVDIDDSILRVCGNMKLYGCTVDAGHPGNSIGELLLSGGGAYLDGDTVVNVYNTFDLSGPDIKDLACVLNNYGWLGLDGETRLSGYVTNHPGGTIHVWGHPDLRIRVPGTLENHGTVDFDGGGMFQSWASGIITGVPAEYVDR